MANRRKVNTVELKVLVRAPKGVSAAKVRRAVANGWHGPIYLDMIEEEQIGCDTLNPRFAAGGRIVKKG